MSAAVHQIRGLIVHDAAIGIVDGNLLAVVFLFRLHVEHVAQGELVDIVVLVDLQTLLDLCLDLLGEHHLVDQFGCHIVLCVSEAHDAVVSKLVQGFSLHLAALGHLLQPVVPDTVQVGSALLAIVFAHTRLGVSLHITLILTYLGHHVFDAEFVVKTLHVFALGAKTREFNVSVIVQIDIVGYRGHIIGSLIVLVGIGHDPLTTLLEVLQGIAQLLGCSRCVEGQCAALQVDTFDVFIVLRLTDGTDQVVQSHGTHVVQVQDLIDRGAFFCPFTDGSVEFDDKHRVFLNFG